VKDRERLSEVSKDHDIFGLREMIFIITKNSGNTGKLN
jgi:hypothetical protein